MLREENTQQLLRTIFIHSESESRAILGFNSSLKSELACLVFWGSVSADLMAEAEGHPNSPFPDFLLRMGPIFNRADVRAAQVSLLLLLVLSPSDV